MENADAIEFLDLMASEPWDTPSDLVNASPAVYKTACDITALARYCGFRFASKKLPGKPKVRGLNYPPVLASIMKVSNMSASLISTGVRRAALSGDLLELRWYARRQQREQDKDPEGVHVRMFHAPDLDGTMPIHEAAAQGHHHAVTFIISHFAGVLKLEESQGIYTTPSPAKKETAPSDSGGGGSGGAWKGLPEHRRVGCILSEAAGRGENAPLHLAAAADHLETVQVLLRCGAEPNRRNASGRTALACAAAKNASPEVIKALITGGADPTLTTHFSETPAQIARRCGNEGAAKAIEELAVGHRQAAVDAHRSQLDSMALGAASPPKSNGNSW